MLLFLQFLQSHFIESIHSPFPKRWPAKEKRLTELPYLFFDTETTGYLANKGDRIISIGAVKWDPAAKGETGSFYRLVNPERGIPGHIEDLTGIRQEMVQREAKIDEVLTDFFRWAKEAIAVGHAIFFDRTFIEPVTKRLFGTKFPLPLADTKQLAQLLYPTLPSYALEFLAEHFSLNVTKRHHALEDARLTGRLFQILLSHLEERGIRTWGELLQYLKVREHPLMKGKEGKP